MDEPMTPPNAATAAPETPTDPTLEEVVAAAPTRECPNVEGGVPHEPHLYDFADALTDPDHDYGNCPGLA